MASFDVIIIGGGVVGTSIARELSRYKIKIAILEKETELAFGVSKSNSGIIHPGTQNPADSLKGKLCVQGNKLVRKISRELGVTYKEVGELIVIFDDARLPDLNKIKEEAEKLGVPGLQIVDRNWLDVHEPNLSQDARAALLAPTAGIISPYRLVYDLAENARKNGLEIFLNHQVERIGLIERNLNHPIPGDFRFEITAGQSVFKSRFLINAAGLFADEISRMMGIDDFTIKPRKGQEFLLDKKRALLTNHLIFPLPSANSKGILVIKTSDGNPMIGPSAEEVTDKTDLTTTEDGLSKILQEARKLIPAISPEDIIAYFAGLRPAAGNDFIIRPENKIPGLVTVAGIQSPGLTAAPAIALMVINILKKNGLELKKKTFFNRYRHPTTHLVSLPGNKTRKLIKENPAYGDIVCRCEMVSAQEIREAIHRGARTLDGIKFRTRVQAGRCHGGFCTSRLLKILAEETGQSLTSITKKGPGSEIVVEARHEIN